MKHKPVLVLLACLPVLVASAAASAQDESPWSGSVDLLSDYTFRGVTQNNRDIALQAGIEYSHGSGFYAGLWGSNISWLSDGNDVVSNSIEFDGYLGWRTEYDNGVSLDVGVFQYYYPGDYPDGFTRPYTTEPYVNVGIAGFSFGYAHAVTNLFGLPDTDGSGYLSAGYEYGFDGGWSLGATVGRQRVKNDSASSYTDWSFSVGKEFAHGFSASLTYVDTNADEDIYTNAFGEKTADAAVVLGLSKSF